MGWQIGSSVNFVIRPLLLFADAYLPSFRGQFCPTSWRLWNVVLTASGKIVHCQLLNNQMATGNASFASGKHGRILFFIGWRRAHHGQLNNLIPVPCDLIHATEKNYLLYTIDFVLSTADTWATLRDMNPFTRTIYITATIDDDRKTGFPIIMNL